MIKKIIQWIKNLFKATKEKIIPSQPIHSHIIEKARRKRQIAKGQLTSSNGLRLDLTLINGKLIKDKI